MGWGSGSGWRPGGGAESGGSLTSVYNVANYGAKGDGVNDDTAAIQEALDAAAWSSANDDGGGLIYFPTPAVAYMFTTLSVGMQVRLMGAATRSSKLMQIPGTAAPWLTATGGAARDGLTIENLYFRSKSNPQNTGGILCTGVFLPKIIDCELNGYTNYAIKIIGGGTQGDAMYALIKANTFRNGVSGANAIWIAPTSGGGSHPDGARIIENLIDCSAYCDVTALLVSPPDVDSAGALGPDSGFFTHNDVIECKTPFDIAGKGWVVSHNRIERTDSTAPGADVTMNLFVRAGTTNAPVSDMRITENNFYTHGDPSAFVFTDAGQQTIYESNYDDLNGVTGMMYQRDRRYYTAKTAALVETFSRAFALSTNIWADGQLYCTQIELERPVLATNLQISVETGGATVAHAQGAVYALDGGTQYAVTGDTTGDRTAFQSSGLKTIPLSSPVTLQPGMYLLGWVFKADTDPTCALIGGASSTLFGVAPRLTAAGAGGYTTCPATFSPVNTGRAYWGAIT